MNTTTPETDEWIKSNVGLHVALANAIERMRKLELQRDNLQKTVDGLCEHFGITPANSTLLVVELLRMKREVDRRAITAKYKDAYFKTLKERDEAREQRDRLIEAYVFDEPSATMFIISELRAELHAAVDNMEL